MVDSDRNVNLGRGAFISRNSVENCSQGSLSPERGHDPFPLSIKRFFVSKVRPSETTIVEPYTKNAQIDNDSDDTHCTRSNCSSYNLGFPLKSCVRVCAVIGMVSSLLYIAAATSLIAHISQTEVIGFSTFTFRQLSRATTRSIYYNRNVNFFTIVSVILVILNTLQLMTDLMLFITTFKTRKYNFLWACIVIDVSLWILTLICFITIFSGGGLFLLLVFLLGTAVRAYITFIVHEYMVEESKAFEDDDFRDADDFENTKTPVTERRHSPALSTIPESTVTVVESFPKMTETNNSLSDPVKINDQDQDKPEGLSLSHDGGPADVIPIPAKSVSIHDSFAEKRAGLEEDGRWSPNETKYIP